VRKFDCTHESMVEGCPSCAEIAAIAEAFSDDRSTLVREAHIPSSAIVWWRAQMRSRREAAEAAAQPITWAQGLILACAAGILVAAIGFFAPTFMKALEWAMGTSLPAPSLSLPAFGLPEEPFTNPIVVALVAALGLSAIVLPIVLYFTFREE
jgi:hypothetical protein